MTDRYVLKQETREEGHVVITVAQRIGPKTLDLYAVTITKDNAGMSIHRLTDHAGKPLDDDEQLDTTIFLYPGEDVALAQALNQAVELRNSNVQQVRDDWAQRVAERIGVVKEAQGAMKRSQAVRNGLAFQAYTVLTAGYTNLASLEPDADLWYTTRGSATVVMWVPKDTPEAMLPLTAMEYMMGEHRWRKHFDASR